MGSLYSRYIKERTGKHCIENNTGFATYEIQVPYCYIEDIYILPEHHKGGRASKLADIIVEIAKSQGCTTLLGTVQPSTKGSTESMKVLLAYGFKLLRSELDKIRFAMEI